MPRRGWSPKHGHPTPPESVVSIWYCCQSVVGSPVELTAMSMRPSVPVALMNRMMANHVFVDGVEVAARIGREFLGAFVEQIVHVERSADDGAVATEDRERRVHRFEHEAVAFAQALIGRLELRVEVRDLAVAAARSVEVVQCRLGYDRGRGDDPRSGDQRRGTGRGKSRRLPLARVDTTCDVAARPAARGEPIPAPPRCTARSVARPCRPAPMPRWPLRPSRQRHRVREDDGTCASS